VGDGEAHYAGPGFARREEDGGQGDEAAEEEDAGPQRGEFALLQAAG